MYTNKTNSEDITSKTHHSYHGKKCVCVCYLYDSVLGFSETLQRGKKVNVGALDELLLCFTKLLLSLSTLEESLS